MSWGGEEKFKEGLTKAVTPKGKPGQVKQKEESTRKNEGKKAWHFGDQS